MRILSIAALVVFVGAASAEDKKTVLTGTWTKKAEGFELKMVFLKDNALRFSMDNGDVGCVLDAKYTLEKDGALKCEVTKFEKKGNFPAEREKGYKFSFKSEIKGKTAKISKFDGDDLSDDAKSLLEGDYEQMTE
jgi:hypothetical protein